jgi:chromosome segregation ATPase
MTAMDTAFSKQALLALAGSGQRLELEGAATISEAKGEIVRLRKQMDALQREAREHDAYLDRLRGEFEEVDEMLPKPVMMMTKLAAEIKEAEAEEAHFQERLKKLRVQKINVEELVQLLYRRDELGSQKSNLEELVRLMHQRAR